VKLTPGPVTDTLGKGSSDEPLIQISGATTYPTTGKLDLTTVSEWGGPGSHLSLKDAVQGWLDPSVAVIPEELLYPPNTSAEQAQEQAASEMTDSQQNAKIAALTYLGYKVPTSVKVDALSKNSASEGKLEVGDIILTVDGTPVATPDELRAQISKHTPGQVVALGVERSGKPLDVKVTTGADPTDSSRPVIGIQPGTAYTFPFTVEIDLRDVGGPSAGLMFALGIIDKLTPESLTGGRTIAGTGTIAADGSVGPIGGIQQKMVGAQRNGATVFFVPAGNCGDAKKAKPKGLQLVKVNTLTDAVNALKTIHSGGANLPAC
jgi:PDZ domain-containing protein